MSDTSLTLGVLGGMGPAATVEFLARLQAYTPAEKDQDHIRVIADINPKAPDRNVPGRCLVRCNCRPRPQLSQTPSILKGGRSRRVRPNMD